MKDVILVQFESKWDREIENVCVATNMKLANDYVYELKKNLPDAYGSGRFYFTSFTLIDE